jgi:succinate dehydrogenase / fumarate reductase cytochrome b subunit
MSTAAASARPVGLTRKQVLSLFGIVPLGVYVVLHLWTNLTSLQGARAFNLAVTNSRNHPAFLFLEIFGLGIPLVAHTIIGLIETRRMRPNNARYGFFNNLEYLLQRLSALGLVLFIGAHVWKARLFPEELTPDGHESWMGMHNGLSEPITFIVYVLGMLGISYHLANGVRTAAMRWGLAVSPRGQARAQMVSAGVFVLLLVMSSAAIYGFQPFQDVHEPAITFLQR